MKKKSWNKKVILSFFLPFVILSTLIFTSCKVEEQNNLKKVNFSDVKSLIHGKVKYVAFGDSFSAGVTSDLLGFADPGQMEDGVISGTSYPAFIANYIKEIDPNKLESFQNFSLNETKIADWLYLLSENDLNYTYNSSYKTFDLLKKLDNDPKNISKGRIAKLFKNFGLIDANDLKEFQQSVKDANLITISLGEADLIDVFQIHSILDLFINNNEIDDDKIQEVEQSIINATAKIEIQLRELIKKVRLLNPTASVSLIGYTMPFLKIAQTINKFIKLSNNKQFTNMILTSLNNSLRKVAFENKINYIDSFDEEFWDSHADQFTKYFYDFYPTIKGYKKIAQDIMLKMALGEEFSTNRNFNIAQNYNWTWSPKYFNNDKNDYNQQIAFSDISNVDISRIVVGSVEAAKLWAASALENNKEFLSKVASNKTDISSLVIDWIASNPNKINEFVPFILKLLGNKDSVFVQNIEKYLTIEKNGVSNIYKLATILAKSGYLESVLKEIQTDFFEQDASSKNAKNKTKNENSLASDNIDLDKLKDIKDIFLNKLFDSNNFYKLVKGFLSSELLTKEPQQAKSFLINIFHLLFNNDALIKQILNLQGVNFSREDIISMNTSISEIITFIRQNTNSTKLIDSLVSNLVDNAKTYIAEPTLSLMSKKYIKSNINHISKFYDDLIKSILANKKILKEVANLIYFYILDKFGINNISAQQSTKLKSLVNKVIVDFPKLKIFNSNKEVILNFLTKGPLFEDNIYEKLTSKSADVFSIFQLSISDLISLVMSLVKNKSITEDEMNNFTSLITSSISYSQLSSLAEIVEDSKTKQKSFKINAILIETIKQLTANTLTEQEKHKIISAIQTSFDALLKNRDLTTLINVYVDKFSEIISNSLSTTLGSSLSWDTHEYLDISSSITNAVKILINKSITLVGFKNTIVDVVKEILNNSEHYKNIDNVQKLLSKILNSTSFDIHKQFSTIMNGVFHDKEFINAVTHSVQTILDKTIFIDNDPKKPRDLNTLKNIITKVLAKTTSLKTYVELQKTLIDFSKTNIEDLINGDKEKIAQLKNQINEVVFNASNNVETLLQLFLEKDNNQITTTDVEQLINFIGDNTSAEKISKVLYSISNSNSGQKGSFIGKLQVFLHTLLKSKYLISNSNNDHIENRTTIKNIFNTIIDKIFANSKLDNLFENLLGQYIKNNLLADNNLIEKDQIETVSQKLYQALFKNSGIFDLIKNIFNHFIDSADQANSQTLQEIFKNILNKHSEVETKIRTIIQSVWSTVVKDDHFSTILESFLSSLFINKKAHTDDQITKIRTFVKKVIQISGQNQIANKIETIIINFIKEAQFLNPNFVIEGLSFSSIFQFSHNEILDLILSIIKSKNISENEITEFVKIVFSNTNLNIVKNSNIITSNDSKTQSSLTDMIVKIVQKIHTTELTDEEQSKTLALFKALYSAILPNQTVKNVLEPYVKNAADFITQSTIAGLNKNIVDSTKIATIQSKIHNSIQTLLLKLVNSDKLNEIAIAIIEDVIKNKEHYKDINDFEALINKIVSSTQIDLSKKVDGWIEQVLSNPEFAASLTDVILSLGQATILEDQEVSQDDKTKIQNVITKISSNVVHLEIYTKLKEALFDFIKKYGTQFSSQNAFENLKTQINQILSNPTVIVNSLLTLLVGTDNSKSITLDEISSLIDIFFKHLSVDKVVKIVNAPKDNSSIDKNNLFAQLAKAIKAFSSSELLKTEANKTKIKNIFSNIVNKILTNEKTKTLFNNLLVPKFEESITTSLGLSKEEVTSLFSSIYDVLKDSQSQFSTIINNLFEDIIDHGSEYQAKNDLQSMITLFLTRNEEKSKKPVLGLIKNILEKSDATKLLAKIIIKKLKLENTTKDDVETITNLFKNLAPQIFSLETLKTTLEELYTVIAQNNIALFDSKQNSGALTKIVDSLTKIDIEKLIVDLSQQLNQNNVESLLLANTFNIIFEKSPLVLENMTSENSPLFYGLREVNNIDKTSMSWKDALSNSSSATGEAIGNIASNVFNLYKQYKTQYPQIANEQNPYYKTIYRLVVTILWYTWQKNFRYGSKWIFWNSFKDAQGTIHSFFTSKNSDPDYKKIIDDAFGNRSNSLKKNYDYKENDTLFMIYYHSYNGTKFKYNEKITVADRIMQMIKNGNGKLDSKSQDVTLTNMPILNASILEKQTYSEKVSNEKQK